MRETQRGKKLAYFYSNRAVSLGSHLWNYYLCQRDSWGKIDERPLRGKTIIPKGKLNDPAVGVLDVENVI